MLIKTKEKKLKYPYAAYIIDKMILQRVFLCGEK